MTAHREPTAAPATGTPLPAVAAGVGVATAGAAASTPAGAALPAGTSGSTRSEATTNNGRFDTLGRGECPDDLPERLAQQLGAALAGSADDPPPKPAHHGRTFTAGIITRRHSLSPEPGGRGLLATGAVDLTAINRQLDELEHDMTEATARVRAFDRAADTALALTRASRLAVRTLVEDLAQLKRELGAAP